jgi:hypothetical protein
VKTGFPPPSLNSTLTFQTPEMSTVVAATFSGFSATAAVTIAAVSAKNIAVMAIIFSCTGLS